MEAQDVVEAGLVGRGIGEPDLLASLVGLSGS